MANQSEREEGTSNSMEIAHLKVCFGAIRYTESLWVLYPLCRAVERRVGPSGLMGK